MLKFSPILRSLWNKDTQTTLNDGPIMLEVQKKKKKIDVAFIQKEGMLLTPSP